MTDSQTLADKLLPDSLRDLEQSHSKIEQIAQYCKTSYGADPSDAIFEKTQMYIKDALSNVAYHVHTVGLHLTNFLRAQGEELDKLDLQIQTLSDRVKAAHDSTGASGFRTMESTRHYTPRPKIQKLADNQLPPNAQPLSPYVRGGIDLNALDNVGITLSGHQGTGKFSSSLSSSVPPPLSSPAPMAAPPAPTSHSVPPPPPMESFPLPPRETLPPPPMMDAPPPPPPDLSQGLDDLPPPPPPPGGDDIPPPPPPRD